MKIMTKLSDEKISVLGVVFATPTTIFNKSRFSEKLYEVSVFVLTAKRGNGLGPDSVNLSTVIYFSRIGKHI